MSMYLYYVEQDLLFQHGQCSFIYLVMHFSFGLILYPLSLDLMIITSWDFFCLKAVVPSAWETEVPTFSSGE